jgi:hypothetical protein
MREGGSGSFTGEAACAVPLSDAGTTSARDTAAAAVADVRTARSEEVGTERNYMSLEHLWTAHSPRGPFIPPLPGYLIGPIAILDP